MELFIRINILILVIICLRALVNGRISRRLQYAMWITIPVYIVLFSFISIPINIDNPVIRNTFHVQSSQNTVDDMYVNHRAMFKSDVSSDNTVIADNNAETISENIVDNPTVESLGTIESTEIVETSKQIDLVLLFKIVWFCGFLSIALYVLISNFIFIYRVRRNRTLLIKGDISHLDVYTSSYAKIPFLFGNKIYISNAINKCDSELKYAVCHEECHYRQGDMLWLLVRYCFLSILWFDPLIWIVNSLIKDDCELAVDETVIKRLGEECRKEYSRSLVKYAGYSAFSSSIAYNGNNSSFTKKRVKNIMNGTHKSIALSLVVSMLLITIVSCSAVKPANTSLPNLVEESEWYSSSLFTSKLYDDYDYASGNSVVFIDSSKLILNESFGKNSGSSDTTVSYISQYALNSDGTATLEYSIDLVDLGLVSDYSEETGYSYVKNEYFINDSLYVHSYEITNAGEFGHMYELSLSDGTIVREINIDEIDSLTMGLRSIEYSWIADGYVYMVVNDYSSGCEYFLVTLDEDFSVISSEKINGIDSYVGVMIPIGNKIYCTVENFIYGTVPYVIDMETMEGTMIQNAPEELVVADWDLVNGRMISADQYGVYEYDLDNNEIVCLMNYNQSNVNRKFVDNLHPIYIDDDSIVMNCLLNNNYGFTGIGYAFWKFDKQPTNPNIGEKIIRVATLKGHIYDEYADAIYQYNEDSSEAFIMIDDRYIVDDYMDIDWSHAWSLDYVLSDEYRTAVRNAEVELSSVLRMDILEGVGPDIILDTFYFDDLNNSQYLIDLREELLSNETINPDDYICAVFAGDNAIYQLPLRLSLIGISWNEDYSNYIGDNYSITYSDYLTLVDECCNGRDPIAVRYGQTDYFVELFKYYYSDYVDGGTINVDTDSFRMMAEFVSTRPETYTPEEDMYAGTLMAECKSQISISDMNDYRYTALPFSSNEESVRLNCNNSIAITTSCNARADALDFVNVVLDNYSEQITVEGLREHCEEYMDWFNNYDWSMPMTSFDGDEASTYIDIIQSTTQIYKYDSDVIMIVYEEIQAYFAGDKTIDEVVEIINNRAQTILDEKQ